MNFQIYFMFLTLITWGDFAFGCGKTSTTTTPPADTCVGSMKCMTDEAACKSAGLEMDGSKTCKTGVCCKEPTKNCTVVQTEATCQKKCSFPSKDVGPAKDCKAKNEICCKPNSYTCVGNNFMCMDDESKCKKAGLEMDKSKTCKTGVCCKAKVNCADHDASGECKDVCNTPSKVLGAAKDCESNNQICCLQQRGYVTCVAPTSVCVFAISCADLKMKKLTGDQKNSTDTTKGGRCSGGSYECCDTPFKCEDMATGYTCKNNIEDCQSVVVAYANDCMQGQYCCK